MFDRSVFLFNIDEKYFKPSNTKQARIKVRAVEEEMKPLLLCVWPDGNNRQMSKWMKQKNRLKL